MFFNLTKTDPNIILSGMEYGNSLNVKKVEWLSAESGFHREGYDPVLTNTAQPDNIDDYEFDIEVGGTDVKDWKYDLPRATDLTSTTTMTMENESNPIPQFNLKLTDKVDNIGDLAEPTLRVYGDGTTIVVESNYDTDLRVYSTAGRCIRELHVVSGPNRYPDFRPDVYIVGGVKLRLTE